MGPKRRDRNLRQPRTTQRLSQLLFPMNQPSSRLPRIDFLDALRGLALLGIVLVHAHDHFNLYVYPPESSGWMGEANRIAEFIYSTFLVSKAFLLFAFLFGMSFFLQLDRAGKAGVDFRKKFVWRLALLFAIGLVHCLFYDGDILTVFAILGLLLIPLYSLKPWILITLSIVLAARLPLIADVIRETFSEGWTPEHLYNGLFLFHNHAAAPSRESVYAGASLAATMEWNFIYGQEGKWAFLINSPRGLQTIAMFILGLWCGKMRFFEDLASRACMFRHAACIFLPCWLICASLPFLFSMTGSTWTESMADLTTGWGNLFYSAGFVCTLAWLTGRGRVSPGIRLLSPIGKATLTCYVSQTLILTFFMFGWGLGLASRWNGLESMLAGAAVFAVQCVFFHLWFRFYLFGPLEWLWRSGTRLQWQPLRRIKNPRA